MLPKCAGYPDHMVFSEFRRRFDVLAPHLTKKHGRNYIVKDEKRVSQSHREESTCQAETDAAEGGERRRRRRLHYTCRYYVSSQTDREIKPHSSEPLR